MKSLVNTVLASQLVFIEKFNRRGGVPTPSVLESMFIDKNKIYRHPICQNKITGMTLGGQMSATTKPKCNDRSQATYDALD